MLYFVCIGAGYILVEVALIQKFVLFLGHPTYSVTAVLFAILLFSGLGSGWSDRQRDARGLAARLRWALPIGILLVVFAVPPLLRMLGGLSLPLRMLTAIALTAPLAFLMGMPFPLGMRALAARGGVHVPWAWAANGCGSVLGSVSAVLGAMLWNFSAMLVLAGVVYAFALARLEAHAE